MKSIFFHTRQLLLVFSILCSPYLRAQTITTVAGNGIMGSGGDGGAAYLAQLNNPYGIAFDGLGNMYISDGGPGGCRVRKVSTAGIITTFAGTGVSGYSGDGRPATDAQLRQPFGLLADGTGSLYITDYTDARIRKVSTTGIISTIAGTGTTGLYSGDGGPATNAEIRIPSDLAVDEAGNLYFSQTGSVSVVRKVNAAGIISTVAGNGTSGFSGDGGAATLAQMNAPSGIAIDRTGNLYIADYRNDRIRKVNTFGIITTIAGSSVSGYAGDGGPATLAQLKRPTGVALDAAGNIFFSDMANYVVRKVDVATGIISTVAGNGIAGYGGDGGPATTATLQSPYGLTLYCGDNLFICDRGNNRVRMVSNGNAIPAFTGGHTQSVAICLDSTVALNTYLSITDADLGQRVTWSIARTPLHGTLAASYTTITTGGTISPAGLLYTPSPGFTGYDTFSVRINDCNYTSDTTTIYVAVSPCPLQINAFNYAGNTLKVSPNPCTGSCSVYLSSMIAEQAHFTITDTKGEKVKEFYGAANEQILVNVDAPSGIYFLSVRSAHTNERVKVVIQNK